MIEIDGQTVKLWSGLRYFQHGEWDVVDEHLKELDRKGISWCPGRKNLFRAMDLTPMEEVRVCLLGQDPYTSPDLATGLAFDVGSSPVYPPTMRAILKELKDDLDIPHSGNLDGWARQGVFLWNVVPSGEEGTRTLTHDWEEWEPLTIEICKELSKRNIVFGVLGSHPKHFAKYIDVSKSDIIYVGHPSPAARGAAVPFLGSRLFSTINANLEELGHETIDWRL